MRFGALSSRFSLTRPRSNPPFLPLPLSTSARSAPSFPLRERAARENAVLPQYLRPFSNSFILSGRVGGGERERESARGDSWGPSLHSPITLPRRSFHPPPRPSNARRAATFAFGRSLFARPSMRVAISQRGMTRFHDDIRYARDRDRSRSDARSRRYSEQKRRAFIEAPYRAGAVK